MVEQSRKFAVLPGYSRGDINRAGRALRAWWLSDEEGVPDDLVQSYMAMMSFRESFQTPLTKTVMGLRSMVKSECPELRSSGDPLPVAQRLKRQVQIINKLARLDSMQLWTMGDIGGCRAVLPSRGEVDGVLRRIRKQKWALHGRIRDYREDPAPSGYRAVHVIVVRDGRLVEIQLRDPREHEWALAVERTGSRLGVGLKEGEGPDDLREYFRLASEGIYMDKIGQQPDEEFQRAFVAARERALPYFRRS
jgi:ppGpp synthetase/RelA/SpoT-type nucleotidyltranferase